MGSKTLIFVIAVLCQTLIQPTLVCCNNAAAYLNEDVIGDGKLENVESDDPEGKFFIFPFLSLFQWLHRPNQWAVVIGSGTIHQTSSATTVTQHNSNGAHVIVDNLFRLGKDIQKLATRNIAKMPGFVTQLEDRANQLREQNQTELAFKIEAFVKNLKENRFASYVQSIINRGSQMDETAFEEILLVFQREPGVARNTDGLNNRAWHIKP